MKEFLTIILPIVSKALQWLGFFLGGYDDILITLAAFVVIDYITSVMCAIDDKKLSDEAGFKGICQKILIFLLVGIANILDIYIIGTKNFFRTTVIFFYISNEGSSLLENAVNLNLPIPPKIKVVLQLLHNRTESNDN